MDRTLLDDKIKNRASLNAFNDKVLKIFIIIFFVGNVFFFTSTLTFPKIYKNVTPTPLGTSYEMGDYLITYDAWDYSKNDGVFEILVEVENYSLSKEPQIEFRVKSGETIYKVNIEKIIDNTLYVLKVEDVKKRFTSASLTITTYDENGDNSKNCKIVVDDRKIGSLTTATSDDEYRIYISNNKIKGYKSEIRKLQKEQQEYAEKITYSFEKVEELEIKKKTQTKEEQIETNDNISKISNEAADLQAACDSITLEIKELERKVKMQRKILQKLEGSNMS